jgi:hypothetical protein
MGRLSRLKRIALVAAVVGMAAGLFLLVRPRPYAYLRHVFAELPKATTLEDIEALLPGRVDREQIRIVNP